MAQSQDISMDIGTSNVLIYMQGKGIVLREPAVVAVDRDTDKVLAIGSEANRLVGRTPGNVQAVRPFRTGSLSDFTLASTMLQSFLRTVVGRHWLARPRCVLSVPTGVSETERRSISSIMFDAHMRRTQMIDRPIAAALGVGIPFSEPYGSLIVDMGAGATDIAVLAMNEIVVATCVPIGGDYFDDAIIRYIRKKHNLLIGDLTAEEIKINIGSAALPTGELAEVSADVTGRSLISGLPKTQEITTMEVYEAIKEPVAELIEAIQGVIEHTPPQLASDVFEDGIVLTGGAAALTGLAEAVYQALNIPCGVAEDPQTSVVMGCARILENGSLLRENPAEGRRKRLRG